LRVREWKEKQTKNRPQKQRKKTDRIKSAFVASTPGGFVDIVAEIETLELVAPAGMTTPSP
jgi:hypothetical protein